ncbi:hypothetical protein HMN09_00062200 [Mycena chlorophos]|uniref:Uncharacterized protein n=1 Tax=Mycena chlorophos TaxID=658473 RepID=A0A8H6TPL9_MYCCL|nr:hypothetical protein HMN09_00062200 [Mycena chlorophos]
MIALTVASTKGNHGIRYFPCVGLLGLTNVTVDGVVRTKLEGDFKPLQARDITVSVRCYESRANLLSWHNNVLVDYTQVLWTNPDPNAPYAEVGDMELPFRITLPPDVGGFSTASYASTYKCSWRVEAVVSHIAIPGVGSRLVKHSELPLVRYDLPRSVSPSSSKLLLTHDISHPHLPPIRYTVDAPQSPIGPLDLVSIPIQLQPAPNAPVTFRSASVIVERRLTLKELNRANSASPNASPIAPTSHPSWSLPIPQRKNPSPSASPASSYQDTTSPLSSTTTLQPLLDGSARATGSMLVNPIAAAESSGQFSLSDAGIWSKTLTLQWPAARSQSRWAIGETIESEFVAVKFFARVKASALVVSSSHGTESVELQERELFIVSTNDAERQLALSKFDEARYSEGGRSKSKSPRRSQRQPDTAPPLPASASRAEHHRISASTSNTSSPSSSTRQPRRPHTSAGPRDKARPPPIENRSVPPPVDVFSPPVPASAPPLPPPPLMLSTSDNGSHTTLDTSVSSDSSNQSDEIREWEEELQRIELRSRRSSDLLAMSRVRRNGV